MIDKKLAFDTLEYATLLKEKGVANPEAHAASLATVIVQNLYTKDEVNKMIEAALQRFDERTRTSEKEFHEIFRRFDERTRASDNEFKEMRDDFDKRTRMLEKELHQLDKNIEKTGSRTIFATVSILGALIAIVGAAATFTHYFVH